MAEQLRQFLRVKQTAQAAGISRSQIYALEADGKFPKRVQLGPRSVAWDAEEVAVWQRERLEQRDAA